MKDAAATRALLTEIEEFLKRHKLSATRFGVLAAGDTKLVNTLRNGRCLRRATRERIAAWMKAQEAGG